MESFQRMWTFFSCSVHTARDQYLSTLSIDVVALLAKIEALGRAANNAVSSLINIGNAADEGDDQSDDEHEKSDDDEPIEEKD